MTTTRATWALVLAAWAAAAPRAQAAAGSDSFEFLLLDGHARPAAMGGAYTALASDASALRYNPAGLGRIRVEEAVLTHNQFVQGVTQQQLSFALRSGFGAQLDYLDFGKIPRTTLANPDGTGEKTGLDDFAFSAGFGHREGPLSIGGAGKIVRETADRTSASGYAVDLGVLAAPERVTGLTLGASLLNVGPDVKYGTLKQKLPTTARLGAAYAFEGGGNGNTFSADLSRTRTDSFLLSFGAETVFAKSVAFRMGYAMRNDSGIGLTGGVGWLWDRYLIGYAFSPYGDLGLAHRVTLTFRWGEGSRGEERPVFSKKSELKPGDDAAALLAAAEESLQRGAYAPSLMALDAADAVLPPQDPRRVRLLERRGTALLRSGKPGNAREAYVDAIKEALRQGVKDAAVTDSYVGLGLISVGEGNNEYALRLFLKAMHLDPKPDTKAMLESKIADLRAR